MITDMQTAETGWNKIYSEENLQMISKEVPSENLIRWFNRLVKKDLQQKNSRVLDIGFGTGSDLQYFIHNGYGSYGIEVSSNALVHTSRKLRQHFNRSKYTLLKYRDALPFKDNSFDFIYSMEALHYAGTYKDVVKISDEIYRVLKPEMHFLVSIAGSRHFFVERSDRLIENEYVFNDSLKEREGMRLFVPESKDVLKSIFLKFHEVSIGYYEYMHDNKVSFFWMVHGKK